MSNATTKCKSFYVTAPNSRTIIGVYGAAILDKAREYAKQKNGMIFEHVGERRCCGQTLPSGAKSVSCQHKS